MSKETIGKMIDLWMNDPGFRSALRQDPEKTTKKMGFQLDDEEWRALKNIDWSLKDEDLKTRVSKAA